MSDDHQKPPETIKEVGIHIGYMRDDIADLKNLLKDGNYVKAKELAEYKLEVQTEMTELRTDLDSLLSWRDKLISRVAGSAVVMLVLMVLAWYGLDKFFK